jgi:hypothetical protein
VSMSPVILRKRQPRPTFELCTRKFVPFSVNSAKYRLLKPALFVPFQSMTGGDWNDNRKPASGGLSFRWILMLICIFLIGAWVHSLELHPLFSNNRSCPPSSQYHSPATATDSSSTLSSSPSLVHDTRIDPGAPSSSSPLSSSSSANTNRIVPSAATIDSAIELVNKHLADLVRFVLFVCRSLVDC